MTRIHCFRIPQSSLSEAPIFGEAFRKRRVWHYTPGTAEYRQAPYFELPFRPGASLRYLYEPVAPVRPAFPDILMLAIAAWTWFTPSLARAPRSSASTGCWRSACATW